jgi:hypothetical protein
MALRKILMLSLSKHAPRKSQSVGQAANAVTCGCPACAPDGLSKGLSLTAWAHSILDQSAIRWDHLIADKVI